MITLLIWILCIPVERYLCQICYNNIISCVYQFKIVSQVHTITNNTLVTIGPVKGFPGYNPLLTVMHNLLLTVMIVQ